MIENNKHSGKWSTFIFYFKCRTERECSADTRIGDMDIPKGMLVQVPIYAIHYDPKIWPEPEKFDPYRFTSEEKAKHTAYDWIPFGSGPRNCIAMRLALAEVKIAVAYLVRAYKFVRCEKTEVRFLLSCGLLRGSPVIFFFQQETRN